MEFSKLHDHPLHIVAMPYPGRGHINPMLILSRLLAARVVQITFVVTEEWLGLLGAATVVSLPPSITIRTIPNVIPSEHGRANDFTGFLDAVNTKMVRPFEELLDCLVGPKVSAIVADTYLSWVVDVGERRGVPVCSLFPMSATFFSIVYHFDDIFAADGSSQKGIQRRLEKHAHGLKPTDVNSLMSMHRPLELSLHCFSQARKARYILFTSCYELESCTIDSLRKQIQVPVYSLGPTIPYMFFKDDDLQSNHHKVNGNADYFNWLDSQPDNSVLYVSLGSFLSVSTMELEELAIGLRESKVKFLWVARGDTSRIQEMTGDAALIVPWCDQLKVLCHPAVGGFLSHCGWNSTMEAVFAGKPLLTLPIIWDQHVDSRLISDMWKIGLSVREEAENESSFTRDDVVKVVQKLMNSNDKETVKMRIRVMKLHDVVQGAVVEGGSSYTNLSAFVEDLKKAN